MQKHVHAMETGSKKLLNIYGSYGIPPKCYHQFPQFDAVQSM